MTLGDAGTEVHPSRRATTRVDSGIESHILAGAHARSREPVEVPEDDAGSAPVESSPEAEHTRTSAVRALARAATTQEEETDTAALPVWLYEFGCTV